MPMAPSTMRSLGGALPSRPSTDAGINCGSASKAPARAVVLRNRRRFNAGSFGLGLWLSEAASVRIVLSFILGPFHIWPKKLRDESIVAWLGAFVHETFIGNGVGILAGPKSGFQGPESKARSPRSEGREMGC